MTDVPTPAEAIRILHDLQRGEDVQHQAVEGADLDPQLALLRAWQSNRLAQTYADLLADERYSPACRFFLSDIYGARDFSQRDHDLEHLYALLSRFVPASMLQLLANAIELNNLTKVLDNELLHALVGELGVTDTITPELYAEGYRVCDNYAERAHQIDLVARVVKQVDETAHLPLAGMVMRLARGPAERKGWFDLYDFLQRGHVAFTHMRNAETFLQTIEERERSILDRIFSGHPDPFCGP